MVPAMIECSLDPKAPNPENPLVNGLTLGEHAIKASHPRQRYLAESVCYVTPGRDKGGQGQAGHIHVDSEPSTSNYSIQDE